MVGQSYTSLADEKSSSRKEVIFQKSPRTFLKKQPSKIISPINGRNSGIFKVNIGNEFVNMMRNNSKYKAKSRRASTKNLVGIDQIDKGEEVTNGQLRNIYENIKRNAEKNNVILILYSYSFR